MANREHRTHAGECSCADGEENFPSAAWEHPRCGHPDVEVTAVDIYQTLRDVAGQFGYLNPGALNLLSDAAESIADDPHNNPHPRKDTKVEEEKSCGQHDKRW